MKIHPHPPLPPPLPQLQPKPPTPFAVALKTEELLETAQQQRVRLRKLFGARKDQPGSDEAGEEDAGASSNRHLDFLA
ncbi:MAG TPA: hypothetical protein VMG39_02330 [Pseudolabrys sp.]|nr:hypothetical protein [Pseudolabrys sp.]